MWEVDNYEKESGRCPTQEFIDGFKRVDYKIIVRIGKAIERLKILGPHLKRPHGAFLRDDIWELRIDTHHGTFRLLYFFFTSKKIIITHGFPKKFDAIPDSEIEKAIKYRNDHIERFSKD